MCKDCIDDFNIDQIDVDAYKIQLDSLRFDEAVYKYDVNELNQQLFKDILKMHRKEMSPVVRDRTKNQKIVVIMHFPIGIEIQYRKYISSIMNVYSDIAIPTIKDNLPRWNREVNQDSRQDDYNQEFQALINEMQRTQVNMFAENGNGVEDEKGNTYSFNEIMATLTVTGLAVSQFNKKQKDRMTKKALGIPFNPAEPWVEDVVFSWAQNNFNLIKSLSDEYIKKVNTIVSEGLANGDSSSAIMKQLLKMDKNMTKARAKLISRDQVAKLNGRLTKRRNQEAGLNLYEWITAGDERVRKPKHTRLNHKICRWDDDTVYADSVKDAQEGNWKSRESAGMYVGIPGSDIQCRCSSIAIMAEINEIIDEEISQEAA
jgi:SPP1 gp7 family putative phage head morphogenesis protein